MNELQVAVGAIADRAGRLLLARRPDHLDQGGLWEFPGGKLGPGESVDAALVRELREELGIDAEPGSPVIEVPWSYGGRRVRLHVRHVHPGSGEPQGLEGQLLEWVEPARLGDYPMPEANRAIARALELPGTYCISDEASDDDAWLAVLEHNCQLGTPLIQMRRHDLGDTRYEALAREAVGLAHRYGARLILNRRTGSGFDMLERTGADGLHLTAPAMRGLAARPEAVARCLIAGSCHGPEEVQRASDLQLDFAVLSPVQPTTSHPTAVPIGWTRFQQWVERAALPVYALGGLSPVHQERATRAGGQGVAGIQGFWNRC